MEQLLLACSGLTDHRDLNMKTTRFTWIYLLGCPVAGIQPAWGQTVSTDVAFPSKTVRIVVPIAPGGGADIQARLFGKKLGESTGQSFIVDNRLGAGGVVGAEVVAKSPADGYTLLFTTAQLAVNASLNKNMSLDPVRDLLPVSIISTSPLVLSVHPSMPVRNVGEFVVLARKRGGDLVGGSNGTGTTSHLALEMLSQIAKLKLVHVPYKGGVPSMTALVGGEVDFGFTTVLTIQPFIKLGKVRPLAVTTPKRSTSLPDLPTMKATFPDFEIDNWYAFFVPRGTPTGLLNRLNEETLKALKSKEIAEYLARDGGEPIGSTVDAAGAHFRKEAEKFAKVVTAGNLRAD
jgi:tripartite-type tricarboxylate transporter receptor subunit TctC